MAKMNEELKNEAVSISLFQDEADSLILRFEGDWILKNQTPLFEELEKKLSVFSAVTGVLLDCRKLDRWDTGFLTFLVKLADWARSRNIPFDNDGLPDGVRRLLELSRTAPEGGDTQKEEKNRTFLGDLGENTIDIGHAAGNTLAFIGETCLGTLNFLRGKARYRRSDLFLFVQDCGPRALPIVSLVSLLIGLILAFIGAVQLQMFGAQIYVANLVGIGMIRVIAAVMVGVIMAGRTGAAFAAQLGTMQVNEEIDALKTLGISPIEFLVVPRLIALVMMMPLLCLYADLMGVMGGLLVGVGMLDLNFWQYLHQTRDSLSLTNLWIGLVHSLVFGVLIALSGCLKGIRSGKSASAVGLAATSAVVTAIVTMVIATAIITLICNVLGI